jgi:antitoxin component HigA of HigAB toxin-antitoxin module
MQVEHIDNNPINNTLANLRWVTPSENVQTVQRQRHSVATPRPIRCIETQTEYPSATIAAEILGLHQRHINAVLTGRRRTTGNLTFEYVGQPDLENELWKDHPTLGTPVSTLGRVINQSGKTYGTRLRSGYMAVRYKGKIYLVHRLVAETFVPFPERSSI